jgi:hypothetical protein
MHQSLVFLFELGNKEATSNSYGSSFGLDQPADSLEKWNGYVTRALRMLRALIKVVNPVFDVYFS